MGYKSLETECTCLECGKDITYGRYDRKFCSDRCRNKYHNDRRSQFRDYRLRMINLLDKNHRILEDLLKINCHSISKLDLADMGFSPTAVTSSCRRTNGQECRCFDIRYVDHPAKITDISYVSTPFFDPEKAADSRGVKDND